MISMITKKVFDGLRYCFDCPLASIILTSNNDIPATANRAKLLTLDDMLHVTSIATVHSDILSGISDLFTRRRDLAVEIITDPDSRVVLAGDALAATLSDRTRLTLAQSRTTVGIIGTGA